MKQPVDPFTRSVDTDPDPLGHQRMLNVSKDNYLPTGPTTISMASKVKGVLIVVAICIGMILFFLAISALT